MPYLKNKLFLLIMLFPLMTWAGVNSYTTNLKGDAITVGNNLINEDSWYTYMQFNPTWTQEFDNIRVKNQVRLMFDEETFIYTGVPFSVTVSLTINSWDEAGTLTTVTRDLTIDLDNASLMTQNDLAVYSFEGGHKVEVVIDNIVGTPLADLMIENSIEIERYFFFDYDNSTPVTGSNFNASTDEYIQLYWSPIEGAEEYELEWFFADDYDEGTGFVSAGNLTYDFHMGGIRVKTPFNSYVLPHYFSHGYLLFRVRAIGREGTNFENVVQGQWSLPESGNVAAAAAQGVIALEDPTDDQMNWQRISSFTENGKRGDLIQYIDGLNRRRQYVTRDNSTNQALVGNNYYDYNGRMLVRDIPAPLSEDNALFFRSNFNTHNSIGYGPDNFDVENPTDPCLSPLIDGMDNTAGVSKYFSDNNPDKEGAQKFVPDAENYPFAKYEYMNDNTDRIKKVGFYGADLQLGTGKEITYAYPSVQQSEISKLFGTEVGYESKYTKTKIVDQNGQTAVYYYDDKGRVIAQALTGDLPQGFDPIGALDEAVSYQDQIIDGIGNQEADFAKGSLLYTGMVINPDASANYSFEYSIEPEIFQDLCMETPQCYDCIYDLEITLTDDCGAVVFSETRTFNDLPIDFECDNPSIFEIEDTELTAFLEKNQNYYFTKKLYVNQAAIRNYTCDYINNNTCLSYYHDFYKTLYDNIDFSGCIVQTTTSTAIDSYCDVFKNKMLINVSPGGQYGHIYDENGLIDESDPTSVFSTNTFLAYNWRNPSTPYVEEDGVTLSKIKVNGVLVNPEDPAVDIETFLDNWRPSWALSLLEAHPEICNLDFCYENDLSHAFNTNMNDIDSYQDGCSTGYLNPMNNMSSLLNMSYTYSSTLNTNCGSNSVQDPFFTVGQGGEDYITDFNDELEAYATVNGIDLNIWDVALMELRCPELISDAGTIAQDVEDCLAAPIDVCEEEGFWENFRDHYLNLKLKYYKTAEEEYVIDNNCAFDFDQYSCCTKLLSQGDTLFLISPGLYLNSFGSFDNWIYYETSDSTWNWITTFVGSQQHATVPGCIDDCPANLFLGLTDVTNPSCTNEPIEPCQGESVGFFVNKTRIFGTFDPADFEPITMAEANDLLLEGDQETEEFCKEDCEDMAQDWLLKLSDCNLSQSESDQIESLMIELCQLGCTQGQTTGSRTAPQGLSTTVGGYTSFYEILEGVLGTGFETNLCTDLMISEPRPYTEDTLPTAGILDQCGCDKVLTAEYYFNLSLPLPAPQTLQGQFYELYGFFPDNLNELTCLCNDVFDGTYTLESVWTQQFLDDLEDANLTVANELTCQTCANCTVIQAHVDDLHTRFSHITDFEESENYASILTNYLNQVLGYNLFYVDYKDFLETCEATSLEPVCDVNEDMEELVWAADLMAKLGYTSNNSSNPIDMSSFIPYQTTDLYRQNFTDHDFWTCYGSCPTDELVMYFGNSSSNCNMTLDFTGINLDYALITGFSNLTPVSEQCGSNNDFIIDVIYYDCGVRQVITVPGTTTCFSVQDCFCGGTETTICDGIDLSEVFADTDCLQDYLDINEADAHEFYTTYIRNEADQFRGNMLAKCTEAFETEEINFNYMTFNYGFTLFYYDKAGNLVKTIAPEGIDDTFTPTTASDLQNTTPIVPSHGFNTERRYNSYGQLINASSPDAGEAKFYYDAAGRIIASQQAEQISAGKYSYIFYDDQDRILETGQTSPSTVLNETIAKSSHQTFVNWANNGTKTEITRYFYDEPMNATVPTQFKTGTQDNVRLRLASTAYYETDVVGPDNYTSAIHYSYDPHGNVIEKLQDVPVMESAGQKIKSTAYEFELISGNMNKVKYQEGEIDQLTQEYSYDENNRLKEAFSSSDGKIKTLEARYQYYDHGPLARIELGDKQVQGMDYAYTINGWLKAMNSTTLNRERDMGTDGSTGSPQAGTEALEVPYFTYQTDVHKYFAGDVAGYTLNYFDGDYSSIGTSSFEALHAGTSFGNAYRQLYNGNIRSLTTAIASSAGSPQASFETQGYTFKYDQLQRLTEMDVYRGSSLENLNTWSGSSQVDDYKTSYTYDNNGNMLTLQRNGVQSVGLNMDNMAYGYQPGTNRLDSVGDFALDIPQYSDIKSGQSTGNYQYDLLGRMVADASEGITEIKWRSDSKIIEIVKSGNDPDIAFVYDPMGQKVARLYKTKTAGVLNGPEDWYYEYFGLDASGMRMAEYKIDNLDLSFEGDQTLLKKHTFYGANRLGEIDRNNIVIFENDQVTAHIPTDGIYTFERGLKQFEISGHTGNVLATITDKKLPELSPECTVLERINKKFGFEDNLEGWAALYSGSITYNSSNEDVTYLGGGTIGCGKTYATQAGRTYTLSVDIKSLGGTTRYIEIYNGTENFNTGTPIASLQHGSGMGVSTLEFTAESSQTHITLRTVTGFSTVTFDDVTISESVTYDVAPETATEWFEDGLNGWSPLYSGTLPLAYNSTAESVTYQGPTTIGCGKVYTTETGKEYTVFVDILSLGGLDRFLEIYDGTGDFTSATPIASLQHGAAAETISLNFTAQSTQTHITMRTVSGFTSVNFDNVVLGEYVEGVRYAADVISSSDYYPYGMPMYGRNSNLDNYSYGFQGMELLNETNGNGNEYITEYRQYDPRLARWTSVDPLMSMLPGASPYSAFANNPILYTDPLGLSPEGGPSGGGGSFQEVHYTSGIENVWVPGESTSSFMSNFASSLTNGWMNTTGGTGIGGIDFGQSLMSEPPSKSSLFNMAHSLKGLGEIMDKSGASLDFFESNIYYRRANEDLFLTGYDPDNDVIFIQVQDNEGNDLADNIILSKLTHELLNKSKQKKFLNLKDLVREGTITPEEFAKQALILEAENVAERIEIFAKNELSTDDKNLKDWVDAYKSGRFTKKQIADIYKKNFKSLETQSIEGKTNVYQEYVIQGRKLQNKN